MAIYFYYSLAKLSESVCMEELHGLILLASIKFIFAKYSLLKLHVKENFFLTL